MVGGIVEVDGSMRSIVGIQTLDEVGYSLVERH